MWNGVATETVAASALKVGDAVYRGADLAPWRIRHVDRFPGGRLNVIASPATVLDHVNLEQFGLFAPTDLVKRVVIS